MLDSLLASHSRASLLKLAAKSNCRIWIFLTISVSNCAAFSSFAIVGADVGGKVKDVESPLSVEPASDGTYKITGLPAGEYYVCALTDLDPNDLYDSAFLDQLVAGAFKITLAAGE